jgi:hypothetical protein
MIAPIATTITTRLPLSVEVRTIVTGDEVEITALAVTSGESRFEVPTLVLTGVDRAQIEVEALRRAAEIGGARTVEANAAHDALPPTDRHLEFLRDLDAQLSATDRFLRSLGQSLVRGEEAVSSLHGGTR